MESASGGPPHVGGGDRLRNALVAVAGALRSCGRPGMVIGGMAVIACGVERLTRDVDATIVGEGTDLESLVAEMARFDIVPRMPDAIEFARRSQVLLLRHAPSQVDVDLSLAWLPFEREAISAANVVVVDDVDVPVARAEDLLVYKAVGWREQDRLDVEQLISLSGTRMDLARVRRLVREVAEALEDESRVSEFEAVLRRGLETGEGAE